MSNFYQDLEKRLVEAKTRQGEAQARFAKAQIEWQGAQAETNAIMVLMQKEKERGAHEPLKPLADFICERLAARAWEKQEIQDEAVKLGYFEDQKGSPGRVFHLTFINLLKSGRIKSIGNDKYQAIKTVPHNFSLVIRDEGRA